MKILNTICYILCTMFLLCSCTKEDLSLCYNKQRVGIKLGYYANLELHTQSVTSIDLYAFNKEGVCVGMFAEKDIVFNDNFTMYIDVAPDTYTFVAWANYNEADYSVYALTGSTPRAIVVGQSLLSQMRLSLNNPEQPVTTKIADLFHGMVRDVQIKDTPQIQVVDMPLIKDANTIRVTLKNPENAKPLTRATSPSPPPLTVELTADNAVMDFGNTIIPSLVPCLHKPHQVSAANDFFEHTVFRMQLGGNMILRVLSTQTDEVVFEGNIIDMIVDNNSGITTNQDFDRISLFDVTIEFGVNSEVSITINGWKIKDPETDLG